LSIFCFGYGYVAQHLAPHMDVVFGTHRQGLETDRLFVYQGDGILSAAAKVAVSEAQAILISIPPDDKGCPVACNINSFPTPKHVIYLSTTGVYGDAQGDWVDETADLQPTSERAAHRLLAEQQWLNWSQEQNVPVTILRLSGIYGPGRSPFDRIAEGCTTIIDAPGHVFNRIHVEDIIQVIIRSANDYAESAIYNLSDDLPANQKDVMQLAYDLLGQPMPEPVELADATLSPMAQEFYRDCKRVCNEKIKNNLGIALYYPTYVEGLTTLYRRSLASVT
jgi:nucleoside-diphosphate-sugar epimerase